MWCSLCSVHSRSESVNSASSKGSQDAFEIPDSIKSSESQPYMVRTRLNTGRPLTDQVLIL